MRFGVAIAFAIVCQVQIGGAQVGVAVDGRTVATRERSVPSGRRSYDIGSPTLRDIWVDPAGGDDSRQGATRGTALRTLDAAWRSVPSGAPETPLTGTGYRILLTAGTYPRATLPNYWDLRYGTAQFPVIVEAADGPRTVVLQGDVNMANTAYVYFINIDIVPEPAGDAFHCESCDHLLLRNVRLNGGTYSPTATAVAHETLKINQSRHVYVEDSTISGAEDNAIDFVGVQYGHIVRTRASNAQDWCAYAKGGSAYLVIEGNEFFDCGTGGFTAGQGTGFQFMTSPWLHYEAYDIRIINNVVHDVEGAGIGVNGGYNVLVAWNTMVRVGSRSHVLEATFGSRSCDGVDPTPERSRCGSYLAAGGWGTTAVDNGSNYVRIPNRHVYFYNNVVYNPSGASSQYQHLEVPAPFSGAPQTGSNAPGAALADDDVRFRGNVIWNGPSSHPLGVGDSGTGCAASNLTCNPAQLRADNAFNSIQPAFVNFAQNDFRPLASGALFTAATFAPPDFGWTDAPAPPSSAAGTTSNAVTNDRDGLPRSPSDPPGAYRSSQAPAALTLDRTAARFGVVNDAGTLRSRTSGQTVVINQAGAGAVAWSAAASASWMTISPASGAGPGSFTVAVNNAANVLPHSGTISGTVTVTPAGAAPLTLTVTLAVYAPASTAAPYGVMDTPLENSTGVTGSIPVTGWALDDVEVVRVRIMRDPVAGEGSAAIFIGDGVFVEGARPDLQPLNPAVPLNTRGGWGHLLLTNFLPNRGNGTFRLLAYADDADGHSTLLGTKTIETANSTATRPFGAVDTPGQGATIGGTSYSNFGWVLSRGTTRADPPGGGTVAVVIDGAFVGSPVGWTSRPDLSSLFSAAEYAGIETALAVYTFDPSQMTNGVHTIAWVVTDNLGVADGIGSRYFTVTGGTAQSQIAAQRTRDAATVVDAVYVASRGRALFVGRRGFDFDTPVRPLPADEAGRKLLHGEELDRFELRPLEAGDGRYSVYLRSGATLGPAPAGSVLDPAIGAFTWQPGVGYIGPYDLLFVRWRGEAVVERTEVRIVLHPKRSNRVGPQVVIDTPSAGADVGGGLLVAGWAVDLDDISGPGVEALHVWAYPTTGGEPFFLGSAVTGGDRPDVAALYGEQYRRSGYGVRVEGLAPGTYDVAVFAWSTVRNGFVPAKLVRVTVSEG